jgi:hypothetical protein
LLLNFSFGVLDGSNISRRIQMNFKKLHLFLPICLSLFSGSLSAALLWVGDLSGNLGTIDTLSGDVNVIGNMGVSMTDIAFDPDGNLYGINFDSLYSINTSTAAVSLVGDHGLASGSKNSLVFGSNGTLYAANSTFYSLNTTTGASTVIGNGGGAYFSSGDLAFIAGQLFLSSTGGVSGDILVALDESTGIGSSVGEIGYSAVYGLATDNNVDLYGVTGTNVISVNTLTGAGSLLLDYGGNGLGAAWGSAFYDEARDVPEPSIIAIMSLGLIGFGAKRLRN